MAELNTTPLIDVMLVLLVMFILSVPVAVHELPFDLPQDGPVQPLLPIRPENLISLTPTAVVTWNGEPVSEAQLTAVLKIAAHRVPEPLIRFEPESGAPYGPALRTLNLIRATDPAVFAFAGTEKYVDFGKPPQR
jgi:biopolymer transport protein ExbD